MNTHKLPKCSAASLTYLPGLRLRLPDLHLCLPSRFNNGKAEQQRKGFRKRASFLKTRTLDINLQKGCFGCQVGLFSARPLNGRLDISGSSWHNSRVFEDRSLDYYILRGDMITLSAIKHLLLGATHTGIK